MAGDRQPTGRDAEHAHEGEAVKVLAAVLASTRVEVSGDALLYADNNGTMPYSEVDDPDVLAMASAVIAAGWVPRADLDAANAEVERATTMNANWQAEYRKARGRALQWSGKFFAANRTVVEQAATIEAVREELARTFAMSAVNADPHGAWREAVAYVREAVLAVLPPVDEEKRNHDQEAT